MTRKTMALQSLSSALLLLIIVAANAGLQGVAAASSSAYNGNDADSKVASRIRIPQQQAQQETSVQNINRTFLRSYSNNDNHHDNTVTQERFAFTSKIVEKDSIRSTDKMNDIRSDSYFHFYRKLQYDGLGGTPSSTSPSNTNNNNSGVARKPDGFEDDNNRAFKGLYYGMYTLFSLCILCSCYDHFMHIHNDATTGTAVGGSTTTTTAATAAGKDRHIVTEEEFNSLPILKYGNSDTKSHSRCCPSVPAEISSCTEPNRMAEHPPSEGKDDDNEPCDSSVALSSNNNNTMVSSLFVQNAQQQQNCCSICIDDFQYDQNVILLPRCYHMYHVDCIKQWILQEQHNYCPLCNQCVIIREDNNDNDCKGTISENNSNSDNNPYSVENSTGSTGIENDHGTNENDNRTTVTTNTTSEEQLPVSLATADTLRTISTTTSATTV